MNARANRRSSRRAVPRPRRSVSSAVVRLERERTIVVRKIIGLENNTVVYIVLSIYTWFRLRHRATTTTTATRASRVVVVVENTMTMLTRTALTQSIHSSIPFVR